METLTNPCSGCRHNCCNRIIFSHQLFNPNQSEIDKITQETSTKYPFLRIIKYQSFDYSDRSTTYPVYKCQYFDDKNGLCQNYPNRPSFCIEAGINHDPTNGNCQLWNSNHQPPLSKDSFIVRIIKSVKNQAFTP